MRVDTAGRRQTGSVSSEWEAAAPASRSRRARSPLLVALLLGALGAGLIWLPFNGEPRPGAHDEPPERDEQPVGDEHPEGDEQPRDRLEVIPDAPDDPGSIDVAPPEPAPADEPPPHLRRHAPLGSWRRLPLDERIAPRRDPLMAWTGQEVLVWGGHDADEWRADGALYDPRSDRWEPLPEAPARAGPATSGTWVDHRMVILGAEDESGEPVHGQLSSDGTWTPAAPPPDGHWDWSSATVWDDRVVVAGQPEPDEVAAQATAFAAYEPSAGRWELLGPAPIARLHTVAAAGSSLVAVGQPSSGSDRAAATSGSDRVAATAFDQERASWSAPDPAPMPGDWTPRATPDPERERVLLLGAAQDRGLTHVAAAWSAQHGWTRLPDPPRTLSRAGPEAFATFAGTVVWTPGDPHASHLLVSPDHGPGGDEFTSWRPIATPPDAVDQGAPAVWTGGELVVWGGTGADGSGSQVALWRRARALRSGLPPAGARRLSGEWTQLRAEDGVRRAPVVAADGDTVAVWGGRDTDGWRADGLLVDTAAGVAGPIPAAPLGGRSGVVAVIAGEELIVWGGSADGADRADGAAFDLTAGTWRHLPDAPLPEAGDIAATAHGDDVVVAAGSAAARYDPVADRWERLADPPVAQPEALVSTDHGVKVLGSQGDAALLRGDAWTSLADHGLQGELAAVVTPGGLLAWDGEQGALYVQAADRWLPIAPPWASGPSTTIGVLPDGVVVWGGARVGDTMGGRLGAALIEPTSRRWHVLPDPPSGVSMDAMVSVDGQVLGWSSEGTLVGFTPGAPRE